MQAISETYARLNQASATVAKTIREAKQTLALDGESPDAKAAMLKVAEIKRQLNELNTTFARLESAAMSFRG